MTSPTSPVAAVMPSLTMCSTSFHSNSPVSSAPSLPPRCTSTSLHQASPPSPATVTEDVPVSSGNPRSSPLSGDGSGGKEATSTGTDAGATNQLNKLKRFLSTVQQFADDISTDIGDRVRALILALVVSSLYVFGVKWLFHKFIISSWSYLSYIQYLHHVKPSPYSCVV